ncbi:MAG: hypothetical protein JW717_04225 [Marinilabiliaceae bacterium]|nr:hypothetical protein [Marinilabiliaceae bacterium]MBN2819110.1 hypothetical protein [Bacteroidales bacterium]
MRKTTLLILAYIASMWVNSVSAQDLTNGLQLQYDFAAENISGTTVNDASGVSNITGEIMGTTVTGEYFGKNALYLPQVQDNTAGVNIANLSTLMDNLNGDYTISLDVYAGENYVSRGWLFGYSANTNQYMCLHTNNHQFAITENSWNNEQVVSSYGAYTKNEWTKVTFVMSGSTGYLYLNGDEKSSNTAITLHPSDFTGATGLHGYLGTNNVWNNGVAQDVYLADFRIYNRALSQTEVYYLNGYNDTEITAIEELNAANTALTFSEILNNNVEGELIWDDLNLMTSLPGVGADNVTISWESSSSNVIANDGKVTLISTPEAVTLTATFSHPGVAKTITKSFTVTTEAAEPLPQYISIFTFEDIAYQDGKINVTSTSNGTNPKSYTGTLEGGSSIRTIGESTSYKVLDLGDQNGYFDMGDSIGKMIYQVPDFTMTCYYMVENEATNIAANGNWLWNFSNSDNVYYERNGYLFARPYSNEYSITQARWEAAQSVSGSTFPGTFQGEWHHLAYSQTGKVGTLYVDGLPVDTADISLLPINLKIEGREGTLFNWLGRSCYANDAYMKNTLIYDFTILGYGLYASDIEGLDVSTTLENLNAAYAENPKVNNDDLINAYNELSIDNTWINSTITSDLTFPTLDAYPTIVLTWNTSNEALVNSDGVVTRPKYYDYQLDSITATLFSTETGETMTKSFVLDATVPMVDGTALTDGKLVHFDFSMENVSGRTVIDVAQAGFKGELKNEAYIRTIGEGDNTFDVLSLADSIGYFDMGEEVGQVMYHLDSVYTIAAYYRIDENYEGLSTAGNFLWTFSNNENARVANDGYLFHSLVDQRYQISSGTEGAEYYLLDTAVIASKGIWQFVAITGNTDSTSTYYLISSDGSSKVKSGVIPNSIQYYLQKGNKLGTPYNWIGRSNWSNDNYLRNTLVYDFRIYNKELSETDFASQDYDVALTLQQLEAAYAANQGSDLNTAVNSSKVNSYHVYASGKTIRISGIQGRETISVYDITGRKHQVTDLNSITVNSGIYIVLINEFATKVIVR